MSNKRHFYFLVILVGIAYLLSGCAVCRPDCRGMTHDDCLALVASCNQVNSGESHYANLQGEVPYSYGAGKLPTEGR